MKIFVTGATGWVGSAIVDELLAYGHSIIALVRDSGKADILKAKGAEVVMGSLDDEAVLTGAARAADAVIHTAFHHDFSHFAESAAQDARAIEWLGSGLRGSHKPMLVTSGLSGLPRGATEDDLPDPRTLRQSEKAAANLRSRGIKVGVVRLACSVHGQGDYGFLPNVIALAKRTGVSAWMDEGDNCWSGVHRADAARVYRMVLEKGLAREVYHAVADEAVPFRTLAEDIARRLGVQAACRPAEHFGSFARMVGSDLAASSAMTRATLGWTPTGPGLLQDLDDAEYFS